MLVERVLVLTKVTVASRGRQGYSEPRQLELWQGAGVLNAEHARAWVQSGAVNRSRGMGDRTGHV